ncbi:hypothetical protein AWC38_SpisGene10750 [Stylophora pistillata]|uniref:Uncharacterized protein n=1 Tax=Stylophora pistillata TaxID=50429 RepID=A0A2B4S6I9_STYPI|nr:hypothetical protein AWC38_SpisGene10750 [Stylophora pistillata]
MPLRRKQYNRFAVGQYNKARKSLQEEFAREKASLSQLSKEVKTLQRKAQRQLSSLLSNCPIPKLLTYNSLVNEIKRVDVGKVYSIEEFSTDIDDENINGCFRDLREYLPRLAKSYLNMQGKRKGALKWFGETEEVPKDTSLERLVTALKCKVKAGRLAKKARKWFDETQGKQGDLQYRFTGKESRLFCHNSARLLTFLRQDNDSPKQRQNLLSLAYIGVRLRDLCSIINRFEVEDTHLEQLQQLAKEYYHANALLLPTSVNPTIWTIGHVVPAHARQVHDN